MARGSINLNANFPFYNITTGSREVALKDISASGSKESDIIQIGGPAPTVDGHQLLLDRDQLLHQDWRVKVWVQGEDAVGSGATLTVAILGSDTVVSGALSSPETLDSKASLEPTALVNGTYIYDMLLPDSWKRNYMQIKLTVGSTQFTAGKVCAEVYAIDA